MKLTKDQFIHQKDFWRDVWYAYAIHETDGGARYLYRVTDEVFAESEMNEEMELEVFRLDGIFGEMFLDHIEKWLD